MGTQQILLIVLSVIIVGAAIAVGIEMFNSQAYSSNKSAIAAEAQTYATQVVQFYKTPVSQGGLGGKLDGDSKGKINNYLGWEEAGYESPSGVFEVTSAAAEGEDAAVGTVVITGKGNAVRNDKNPQVVTTVSFPNGTISAVLSDEPVSGGGD